MTALFKHKKSLAFRAGLHCSVSGVILIALGASSGALAQQTSAAQSENDVTEVTVTATRVVRNGYEAPTPTSVIGADEIAAQAPANLADFVNELPALAASASPRTTVGSVSPGTSAINALNLRDLGPNRTLVLLDGQRVGASTLTGWVDINQFPQALVKRVDVVTGGASADWGSDAVAGVVNFILDRDYTGLKGEVEGGLTTYGDDATYKASMAGGTGFANGRGHILFSGEVEHNDGVSGIGSRSWYNGSKVFANPNYTSTNGQPQLIASAGVGFGVYAPGGLINSGPLKGTYFGPGGTPLQFNYGPVINGSGLMQGGQWQLGDFGLSGDLDPEMSRYNLFLRSSYDVSDNIELFVQASYSDATSSVHGIDEFKTVTIQPDNAFIPTSIASKVGSSFSLGTLNQDLGSALATTDRSSWRLSGGANGDFHALGTSWKWDVYDQETTNDVYTAANLIVTANYANAVDAVRNPATGAIVCRSTLSNPGNGCVPFNVFGTGVNSQAATNYVLGNTWGRSLLRENVAAANLHGDPLSNWAGPISVALGVEHRKESVTGNSDALDAAVFAVKPVVPAYFSGNFHPSFGSYDVTEGYFETVIPLAKDMFLAKSLDLNGAVRATDYSTATGLVSTYKVGATYTPIDDITFRVTQSHDIRAPNLAELFQNSQTSTGVVTDPSHGNANSSIFAVTSGNTGLKPEVADSTGLGAVLKPRLLPGFTTSVDYYDTTINNAIQAFAAQTYVAECAAGFSGFCPSIVRSATGAITQVNIVPINLSQQLARGLDFEASYRRKNLDELLPFLAGNLTLRLLATHYLENTLKTGISTPINNVGANSENNASQGINPSLPKWRYMATMGWDYGNLSTLLTIRGFSDGVINTSYIQCTSNCPVGALPNTTINNNHLPGAIYYDANISYQLPHNTELYLVVDNVANTPPVQAPYGPSINAAPISVNPALYDVLGRTFRMGFRFEM